ncbi:hypothetical protein [Halorarum salinum]|uniref:Uncharacterized protein n=1 Tax=Halorarum salinum TaxID=2743089 RepID=A0A7D5LA36_9EURY|nr:hypothetical protein [Halobaculum salinum]QLG61906.1 hypothetical protein HUG12_09310 [Halobaculum salinum]
MSRRAVIAGIAALSSFSVAGRAESSATRASLTRPTLPDLFAESPWETVDYEKQDNNDVAWIGASSQHAGLREKVKDDLGVDVPQWRLYAWTLQTMRSEAYIDFTSEEDDSGMSVIDSLLVGYGPGAVEIDLDDIANHREKAETIVGATALEVFSDQLETDYPFTDADLCTGLYESEWGTTCRRNDISYSNAEATIEDEFTLSAEFTAETEDDDFVIDYRALLVVQTYDRGQTYIATGAVYPEEMEEGWLDEYEFDQDFIGDSRAFMKAVR